MQSTGKICYYVHKKTISGFLCSFFETYPQYLREESCYIASNSLSEKLDIAGLRAAYDENAKLLLANRVILSHILAKAVKEYQGMESQEIISLLEATPQISSLPVLPGQSKNSQYLEPVNRNPHSSLPDIIGEQTENAIPGEGSITFDVRLHAWHPDREGLSKLLIDLEMQRKYYPGYDIVTRGVFYGSRMISAQYGTEFDRSEYDNLKKVYSIWICTDVPTYAENTVTEYSLVPKQLEGNFTEERSRHDLLSVIVIGLPKKPEELADGGLPGLLGILFSARLSVREKKEILKTKYHISMTEEMERRENIMCNLSEGIEEAGIRKGMLQGIQQGMLQGIVETCKELDISKEITLKKIIEKFSLSVEEAERQMAKYWTA